MYYCNIIRIFIGKLNHNYNYMTTSEKITKPYPISEPCPDDPEGWTDKNGVYHYDSIHQAKWDKWH